MSEEVLVRTAYCSYLEGTSRTWEESAKEFYEWLDSVKAAAWDEGANDALENEARRNFEGGPFIDNPYRKPTKETT